MKLYHKILLCLFLLLGVTIWEFVTVEPVQADPGGAFRRQPMLYCLMFLEV